MKNLDRTKSQMKQLLLLAVFGFGSVVGMTGLSPASAGNSSNLIIPGQSIGQTYLGKNGKINLSKLPKPTAYDAGMSQTRQVWVSKKGNKTDTLYIHTVSNGALNVQPLNGVTIDLIRVTSGWFHTSQGNISTGNTKSQILRRFPHARPVGTTIYDDAEKGIAFEFAPQATDSSPCIAIMVHPSGNVHYATQEQVNRILNVPK